MKSLRLFIMFNFLAFSEISPAITQDQISLSREVSREIYQSLPVEAIRINLRYPGEYAFVKIYGTVECRNYPMPFDDIYHCLLSAFRDPI